MTPTGWLMAPLLSLILVGCGGGDGGAQDGCDQGDAVSNECADRGEGMYE